MTSTKREYFEEMYDSGPDPWGFDSSPYERRKYAVTEASLPKPRYRSAYEPGCSIGVLTERLASRCDHLLATDIIPAAVEKAAARCEKLPHVRIELRALLEEWPDQQFDLVVLSEIAYYFDAPDLERIMSLVLQSTQHGAHIIGAHWRGTTDYPLSGDNAHVIIGATRTLHQIVHHVENEFVLDVWERRS
jgi:hypothetical protein